MVKAAVTFGHMRKLVQVAPLSTCDVLTYRLRNDCQHNDRNLPPSSPPSLPTSHRTLPSSRAQDFLHTTQQDGLVAITRVLLTSRHDASMHALVALSVYLPDEAEPQLGRPSGALLHWGTTRDGKPGAKWHAPPPGWKTSPEVSYDAGHGAWQTPFASHATAEGVAAHAAMLQLPLEGDLASGGVSFVVKVRVKEHMRASWVLMALGNKVSSMRIVESNMQTLGLNRIQHADLGPELNPTCRPRA